MYERMLVPLDGSELAKVALNYAGELGARLGSEITLLSVVESAETQGYRDSQSYLAEMVQVTKRHIRSYFKKPETKVIKVGSQVLVGEPAEQIVDFADRKDIGLIVMVSHGQSGVRHWALGSVTNKVVMATKHPVAVIRAKRPRSHIRRKGLLNKILVPLDGSKESEKIIPYIEELASRLGGEVVLLQVLAPTRYEYTAEGALQVPYTTTDLWRLQATLIRYLGKLVARLKDRGITTSLEVEVGIAGEEIIKFADENNVDIVAMSTHGLSGLSYWSIGSVAYKVLQAGNSHLMLVGA